MEYTLQMVGKSPRHSGASDGKIIEHDTRGMHGKQMWKEVWWMNGGLSKIDPKWKTHIWRWEVIDVFPEKRETAENVLCFEDRWVF